MTPLHLATLGTPLYSPSERGRVSGCVAKRGGHPRERAGLKPAPTNDSQAPTRVAPTGIPRSLRIAPTYAEAKGAYVISPFANRKGEGVTQ